jgi:outer membrane autotransporter protein
VGALTGYVSRVYGACVNVGGTTYQCSGAETTTRTITADNADVDTVAGFSVDTTAGGGGNAIEISGDGAISYTDLYDSPLTATLAALQIISTGDVAAGNLGSVTVDTNGTLSGYAHGIFARNYGTGALSVTADGDVTGTTGFGISARNGTFGAPPGTDLTVTTGAGTTVIGKLGGIDAYNYGSGALTITANGDVTGTNGRGIYAGNAGTNLTVITGAGTTVTGVSDGIGAFNFYGSGALTITANGDVTGTNGRGIFAYNSYAGTDLTVITGAGVLTGVTGYTDGIYARNYGTGALSITANGEVTGTTRFGISARSGSFFDPAGTDLTVTTGVGTTVIGNLGGIDAYNYGSGALTITANGDVTGTNGRGIYAGTAGTNLTVITGAGTTVTGVSDGIGAFNFYGSGALTITANGDVTGTNGRGIFAYNAYAGTDLTVITGAGTTVAGDSYGIDARNYGSGTLSITANGDVSGANDAGVYARNDAGGPINITVGATSTVSSTSAFALDIAGGPGTVMLAGTLNGGAGGALRFDQFAALDDRLELETGAVVNGAVRAGPGADTLALTGTGTGSFDVGTIGAGQQFLDFETFQMEGAGTWTLTGTNATISGFTVDGGVLLANATMATTSFTVNSGGTLGGSGTLGDVTVSSGGTLAPGNSPGILNVNSLTLNAGSVTQMEIDGTTPGTGYDQINVTTTATLDGTLDLVFSFVPTDGDQFNLINAGNLVLAGDPATGFATLTTNLGAALLATPVIDPTTFDILIALDQQSFVTVGGPNLTMNQQNVATVLDVIAPTGQAADLIAALDTLSADQLPGAFDSLSGVQSSHAQTLAIAAGQQLQGLLFGRLGGGGGLFTADSGARNIQLAFNGNDLLRELGIVLAAADNGGAGGGLERGLWVRGFGSFGEIDDTASASGADHDSAGVAVGVDREFDDGLVAGAAFGYLNTDADTAQGDLDVDSFQGALYGGWTRAAYYLNGSAQFGFHDIDSMRRVTVGGFDQTARADFDGWTAGFATETGLHLALGGTATLTPFFGLDYTHLRRDGFTEAGAGSANLAVDDEDQDSLRTRLGLRLEKTFTTSGGLAIRPVVEAAWVHESLDDDSRITAGFAAAPGTSFRIAGPDLDRDRAHVAAGVTAVLTESLDFDAGYTGDLAGSDRSHNFAATLRWRF